MQLLLLERVSKTALIVDCSLWKVVKLSSEPRSLKRQAHKKNKRDHPHTSPSLRRVVDANTLMIVMLFRQVSLEVAREG